MLRIQQYHQPASLDEAYELLQQNRNNQIIAGMLWLKMQERTIPAGIDLSKLHLNRIEEDDTCFTIGAMVSLRDLEVHPSLNAWCDDIIKESVKDIVGVQFRNMATIGGSIYSRFGFSDILCALLCLDCDVIMHHGGKISLKDFVSRPYERDILTHIIIHKTQDRKAFACVRKSATDLSVLNVSASKRETGYHICVGARPKRAMLFDVADNEIDQIAEQLMKQVPCEDNMRASEAYRRQLVKALCVRVLTKIKENDICRSV